MLEQFGPEIWIAGGDNVEVFGFRYPTRMVVIRLNNGDLFICSPIRLNDALRASVDALGSVRHIVAPNSLHHLSVPEWRAAYPNANLSAAPKLRGKRTDITFDADLGDAAPTEWAGEIDQVIMSGNRITSEVVFFHAASKTALFTDLLQQFPKGWFKGWRAIIAKLDLMMAPEPSVPRKFRAAFTDRGAARVSLSRILAWPTENVLMAHGPPVSTEGKAFLSRAFRWLKP